MFVRSILGAAAVLAACSSPAPAQRSHPEWRTPAGTFSDVRMERVRLSTGIELEVAQAGPRDGTPVLFLHGYTDSWFSFSQLLERLPPGLRAIVPSQRGHGDSERPGCCYGIGDFAADGVALLDALGIERATIVGHSMGSFVAQQMAAEWPHRIEKVVLIGSGTTLRTEAVVEFSDVVRRLSDPIAPEFIREFQVSTVFHAPPAPFMARVVAESGKVPARVWRDVMTGMLGADSGSPLHVIRAPVLVIWGDQDELFPRVAQDSLTASIRGARFIAYAGTGHAPHWERPARFVEDLRAFLSAGVEPASAGSAAATDTRSTGEHVHTEDAPASPASPAM